MRLRSGRMATRAMGSTIWTGPAKPMEPNFSLPATFTPSKRSTLYGPPTPVPDRRPTIQEIYENFRLPEELLSGSYANSVLIGHSPTEFFFDFITGFYP